MYSNQRDRAEEIVGQILRIHPKFSVSGWQGQRALQFRDNDPHRQFIVDAFRAAGVPE